MALAYITFDSTAADNVRLRFDIGTNRYFVYAVGSQQRRLSNGLKVLDNPDFSSSLQGPIHESTLGRGHIDIEKRYITRENNLVQLTSFREADRTGPALSNIVRIPIGAARESVLPAISFAKENTMEQTREHGTVETVAMTYREIPYSQSMFFQALVGMLPQLLPAVGNLLGGLTGGSSSGGGARNGGGGGRDLLSSLTNPDVLRQITQLIAQISRASTPAAPAQPVAAQPSSTPGATPPVTQSRQQSYGMSGPYSEAKIAPALLAALPALMPLLQNVLSPQTIQGVINAPNQHLNTVINGIKDFARLGIESAEQDLRHLRELNPGVDDPALDQLLASLSVAVTEAPREISFTRAQSVSIDFIANQSPSLFGKQRPLYMHGEQWRFPVQVQTPRTINKAIVEMVVKDPETLSIVAYKKEKHEQITTGVMQSAPYLDKTDTLQLTAGKEYLVCVAVIWKNHKGQKRGTSRQQTIFVVNEYSFDRVEESSELIPLNDAQRFRDYWHKIWQGTFKDDLKRFEFKCKYYTVLRRRNENNARIETKIKIQNREPKKVIALLKAGMEYSPEQLNRLIPQILPGTPMLSEPELAALNSSDFAERFNQAARYVAKLRGRDGDTGSLWVYPEVKMQTVILQKTASVNSDGVVANLEERRAPFPIPVLIHFTGARTE